MGCGRSGIGGARNGRRHENDHGRDAAQKTKRHWTLTCTALPGARKISRVIFHHADHRIRERRVIAVGEDKCGGSDGRHFRSAWHNVERLLAREPPRNTVAGGDVPVPGVRHPSQGGQSISSRRSWTSTQSSNGQLEKRRLSANSGPSITENVLASSRSCRSQKAKTPGGESLTC